MLKRLFAFLLLPLLCLAAMAEVPELKSFYPNSSEKVLDYKQGSKIYVYFADGSKIVSATGRLVQDGQMLGTVLFKCGKTLSKTATLTPTDEENKALENIQPGVFSIEVYGVSYEENGETLTYTNEEQPLGITSYHYAGMAGTVVSETGLDGNVMKSYYPADGTEGLKTFTFSKPIVNQGIEASLEYGYDNMHYLTAVPFSLSDDGLTLTVDLRGKAYDSATLAYGNKFYDIDGNPVDPPVSIALVITNLVCTDGTLLRYAATSLDGMNSSTLTGRIHKVMHYDDITFPTPVLKAVAFYPSANPSDTHAGIVEGCDMMALTVLNAAVIKQTDVVLTSGDVSATIAWADITVNGDVLTAALPAEIVAAGSDGMVISLDNYAFYGSDGVEHVVKPLSLASLMREVNSIAALKALGTGETVALNVTAGVRVTLSNEAGYCFIEDDEDGLMVVTDDYSKVLDEGTLLLGKIVGSYQGNGMFMIMPEKSDYTATPANVACGLWSESVAEALVPGNVFRLITFVANGDMGITFDGEYFWVDGLLPVLTNFVEDELTVTEPITDITGVLYYDESVEQYMLLMRSSYDVNQGLQPTGMASSAGRAEPSAVFNLMGIRLDTPSGCCIRNGKKYIVR